MSGTSQGVARARLGLYNAALLLVSGPLLAKKAVKFGRRGHRHEWDMGRWNSPAPLLQKDNGTVRVVFVALSWGEVTMMAQLSSRLEASHPHVQVVWAIRDRSAQEMAKAAYPLRLIVPMPFDFAFPANAWTRTVQPDVLVVVEKFWWPNLIWSARLNGSATVLINGRSRGREKTRYRWMSGFQRWVLSAFDVLCFESDNQIERVADVLPHGVNAQATGNIKFGFNPPSPPSKADELEAWLQNREGNNGEIVPLMVAGSTSEVDEEWALQSWQTARQVKPCALLLAPRRPERAAALVTSLEAQGHTVSLRSQGARNPQGASVMVLDTMGELSYLYRAARAAYVGGAVGGRGHNIIEPLAWGIPVSYGPNRGDFEAAQRAAEEREVGVRLRSPDELAEFWKRALCDEEWGQQVAVSSRDLIAANRHALDATVAVLETVVRARK